MLEVFMLNESLTVFILICFVFRLWRSKQGSDDTMPKAAPRRCPRSCRTNRKPFSLFKWLIVLKFASLGCTFRYFNVASFGGCSSPSSYEPSLLHPSRYFVFLNIQNLFHRFSIFDFRFFFFFSAMQYILIEFSMLTIVLFAGVRI